MVATVKMPIAADNADAPAFRAIGSLPSVAAVSIAAGEALSDIVNMRGAYRFAGLIMPPQWTAADITFRGSFDGTTFYDVFDNTNAEYKLPNSSIVAGRLYKFPITDLAMFPVLQLRSGVAGAQVNQAQKRDFLIIGV